MIRLGGEGEPARAEEGRGNERFEWRRSSPKARQETIGGEGLGVLKRPTYLSSCNPLSRMLM